MEDLATDRIYRLMIAQRMRHRLEDTPDSISRMFDEELDRIATELPPNTDASVIEKYRTARNISESLIRNQEFDPI
jgi:malate synthase